MSASAPKWLWCPASMAALEYVHTDYGEFRFDPTTFGDLTRGQVMVGAGFRF